MNTIHDPEFVPDQAAEEEVRVEGFNVDSFDEAAPADPADRKYEISGRALTNLYAMAQTAVDFLDGNLSLEEAAALLEAGGDTPEAWEQTMQEVDPLWHDFAQATNGTCGREGYDQELLGQVLAGIRARMLAEELTNRFLNALEALGYDITIIQE